MLRAISIVVAVVGFAGLAWSQGRDPVKQCGALNLRCINDNFSKLRSELDRTNKLVNSLSQRLQSLETQVNDTKKGLNAVNTRLDDKESGLGALKGTVSAVSAKLNGNLQIREVNRNVCLEWFSTGGPGAAFLPCDTNRIEQVFKLEPR